MLGKGWRKFCKTFWDSLGATVWFTRRTWNLRGLLVWILFPLTPWSTNLEPSNGAGCENHMKLSGEPCLFFQGVRQEHYLLGSFSSVAPTNNFLLPRGATLRLILRLRGNPPVLFNNQLFCLWTSAASWLWSQVVICVGTRWLAGPVAVPSLLCGGIWTPDVSWAGFGEIVATGHPQESPMKGISVDGSSRTWVLCTHQGRKVPESCECWEAALGSHGCFLCMEYWLLGLLSSCRKCFKLAES